MAPNIFGLHRALRMDTFSSFGSFRDVKPSLACFLKLCSCAMFACGCAMFVCGYAVLARDQTRFLHSISSCVFVEWWDFAWLRHVFPIGPCFCRCPRVFIDAPLFFVFSDCAKNFVSKIIWQSGLRFLAFTFNLCYQNKCKALSQVSK